MEKDMYATELRYASPSSKEKKQYSYDLRVKRINALIEKLEEKNKNAKFLSIWYWLLCDHKLYCSMKGGGENVTAHRQATETRWK